MLRLAPKFIAVFLLGTALAGCASTANKLAGGDTASSNAAKAVAAAKVDKTTPTDLDGGVRQAQLMRNAGQYDDAIRVLSQLMLVASDDPRVVSEYGKTLAQKGRAQDAVQFLNRAIELSSNDWTLYSALGVSYDQLGNQPSAKMAYEHALTLRPEEPSVLNNYALSRMMAGDVSGAHALIARAKAAGGASDSKIAANIELLNKVAPLPDGPQNVATAQKPEATKPVAPASTGPKPLAPQSSVAAPQPLAAQTAPHSVVSSLPPGAEPVPQKVVAPTVAQQRPKQVAVAPPSGTVMQSVPSDPYAGPAKGPAHAGPVALRPQTKTADAKPVDTKPAAAPKPGSPEQAAAIYLALKGGDAKTATKTADAKPADTKPVEANGTKPGPVRTAAKDDVPALRLTADARSP